MPISALQHTFSSMFDSKTFEYFLKYSIQISKFIYCDGHNHVKMAAVVYKIRKPKGEYDLSLPCYFRRVFGPSWDILYGLLAILSFALCSWFEIEGSYYSLLLTSYFDLIIIADASMSLFIRFYQSIQVVVVNRYIESFYIALWMMLGFTLDFISCVPYLAVAVLVQRKYVRLVYQMVCLLRFGRLYTSARRYLDKSKLHGSKA